MISKKMRLREWRNNMKQIITKSSKLSINRCIAGTLLLGSSPIVTTKIQATQAPPAQTLPDQEINTRKDLLDLRKRLFQKNIGNKEAMKALCRQLISDKAIDLNVPICAMTLLEEAILRRLEDAAEILIELSDEMEIPLGRKDALDQINGPSLLHIATYNPRIMNDALDLREKFEKVKKDTEVSKLYEETRATYSGRSYASKKIVEALLKTNLKSKINEPEWPNNQKTTPFYRVKQFLATMEYLKKHPGEDPEHYTDFEAEYKKIMKLFRCYD
jgi:hypothetical protein